MACNGFQGLPRVCKSFQGFARASKGLQGLAMAASKSRSERVVTTKMVDAKIWQLWFERPRDLLTHEELASSLTNSAIANRFQRMLRDSAMQTSMRSRLGSSLIRQRPDLLGPICIISVCVCVLVLVLAVSSIGMIWADLSGSSVACCGHYWGPRVGISERVH